MLKVAIPNKDGNRKNPIEGALCDANTANVPRQRLSSFTSIKFEIISEYSLDKRVVWCFIVPVALYSAFFIVLYVVHSCPSLFFAVLDIKRFPSSFFMGKSSK